MEITGLNKKRAIYLCIAGFALVSGLMLTIIKSGDRWAFHWKGAALMAQPKEDVYHDLSSLQIFNRVLLQLQENYVEASRLDPALMLASGLDSLQKSVPELLLVFDKKVKDRPTQVTVRIAEHNRTFSLQNVDTLWEMSLRLREVLKFIQDYLPKDVKPRELEYEAVNGMLRTLDPHSLILSPEVYRDMMEGNRGKFGGLGIMVRMIDGILVVMEPMPGEPPAVKAGIQPGDQILAIDGTPTLNMTITEAVDLLKGEPATTVKLTVMRKGWKESRIIGVVRDEIVIPSIESADLGDRIAYVKLKGFQSNSQSDLLKALENLNRSMGGIGGLILDLRGNPGGLLDQAVLIANDFLSGGTIVTTVGASDRYRKPYEATEKSNVPQYPLVVLIDSASASASEIVAGALKNHQRALILGDTSFGKGSVQVLYELPDKSALKLTIAQYLTPGDQSIQSVGIVPDIRLVPMRATKDELDLYPKPWVRRESSLGGHLDNQLAAQDLVPQYNLRYLSQRFDLPEDGFDDDSVLTIDDIDKIIKRKPRDEKPGDDPQVRLAKRIVQLMGNTAQREAMLERYALSASALSEDEDQALARELSKFGIDWARGKNPDDLSSLKLRIETDNVQHTYEAGTSYTIRATVTNTGSQPVYRIVGRSEASFKRIDDKEFIFGRIAPNQSITRELVVRTNRAQSSRLDRFAISLFADDDSPTLTKPILTETIELTTKSRPQPSFSVHYAILDRDQNDPSRMGNGLLDDDETITVRVWIANDGDGVAEKPLIFLKNKAPEIKLIDARAETPPLERGQMTHRDFVFQTQKVTANPVVIELHVYDKASTQMLVENIGFITSKSDLIANAQVIPSSAIKRVIEQVPLFVSPTDRANTLVSVPVQTVVQTNAVVGDFTHITAGEVIGWVATTALQDAAGVAVTPLEQTTTATIPRIVMAPNMPLAVESDTFTLKANVTSFAPLKDYYVYIISEVDHTLETQKVAYEKIESGQHSIQTDIPLQPGLNRVRVFVRDEKNSEAYETLQVYRK